MNNSINIKFKKLCKKAVVPTIATSGSVGMDLVATSRVETDKYIEYGLGFATEMPSNVFAFIVPNSRISKYDLFIRNAPCTIDADYRGEWKIRFGKIHTPTKFEVVLNKVRNWMGIKDVDATVVCSGQDYKIFQVGDVVGQAIFLRYDNVNIEEVTELSDTIRGEGGFGSTEKLVAEPTPTPAIVVEQPTEPKPKRKRKKNA